MIIHIYKLIIIFISIIGIINGLPEIDNRYQIYSERRNVRFFGAMTVNAGESDVVLNALYNYPVSISWILFRDGYNVFERSRITTIDNSTYFQCVMTHDSGLYSFVQSDSLNTGFNVQTARFNLTVTGPDRTDGVNITRMPSATGLIGQSFAIQPILRFEDELDSQFEPFIVRSPNSNSVISKRSGIPNNIITYTRATVDPASKTVHFSGLTIIGEPGDYIIGFVSRQSCRVAIVQSPIRIVSVWPAFSMVVLVAVIISFGIVFLTSFIKLYVGYRRSGRFSMQSLRQSFQAPIQDVIAKNMPLGIYFKALRLFITQSVIFSIIALLPLVPITVTGDNVMTDVYKLAQANWSSDSGYLFVYFTVSVLLFASHIVIYTRFNNERIYHSHDSNHLVTSRSVLLYGLPKSLIDCSMLRHYLQTSYSKGIYSLTIILEKSFTVKDKMNDLDGKTEIIFMNGGTIDNLDNNGSNIDEDDSPKQTSPIKSTGTAFITFSCVSDAHLFKTQFSPHRWAWAKEVYPIAPPQYQAEMQMKNWKSYAAPPLSDLLWTKLHNPSNLYGNALTIFLIILSIIFFSCLSMGATIIYDSQFEKLRNDNINFRGGEISLSIGSFWFYIFLPCCILMFTNRLIPICIKSLLERSSLIVRSSLKSKIMLVTFYSQVFAIAVVPSSYFLMMMGMITFNNFFYTTIDFFRTGGLFYTYFILFYSIISPILDSCCFISALANIYRINKTTTDELSEKYLNLTNQYTNMLLMILLISFYGPFFPLLFLLLVIYLLKKYYFDKYIVIAAIQQPPPADITLIEPLQHCIWLVLTVTSGLQLVYVMGLNRYDIMFICSFLLLVGFGRYVPSCAKSLCYSACDGAILPCIDNPNRIDDEDEDEVYADNNEMKNFKQTKNYKEFDQEEEETGSEYDDNDKPKEYIDDAYKQQTNSYQEQEDTVVEMKDVNNNNDNRTILNIQQQYSTTGSSEGTFSFLYRFRLPKPKSITIAQYTSPYYNTKHSQCTLHEEDDIEGDDIDDDDDDEQDN